MRLKISEIEACCHKLLRNENVRDYKAMRATWSCRVRACTRACDWLKSGQVRSQEPIEFRFARREQISNKNCPKDGYFS